MKVWLAVDLGEIEVEANSATGRIDEVWVGSKKLTEIPAHEFVIECMGGYEKFQEKLDESMLEAARQ